MGKIFDRLLIEFLIPAVLMLDCLILAVDLLRGSSFNLTCEESRKDLLDNHGLLAAGILLAYIINTSLSSLFNLWWRIVGGGKIREYLMYRKLDLFKDQAIKDLAKRWGIKRFWLWSYFRHRADLVCIIEKEIKNRGTSNLYGHLLLRLREEGVPEASCNSILDIYDVVRTKVMSSQDSAIIGWIQYHWSQLRLARSTIIPSLIMVVLLIVLAFRDWNLSQRYVVVLTAFGTGFFTLQLYHYYYRERFMIYAMLGYFLSRNQKTDRATS